jgi:hypothetical protein
MEMEAEHGEVPPHASSWADRLMDLIDRAGPAPWMIYSAAGLLLCLLFTAIQAWQGTYNQPGFQPWHLFIAIQPLYPLAAMHYLDRTAAQALEGFREAMEADQHALRLVRYQLTTTPARGALIASLLGVAAFYLLFVRPSEVSTTFAIARIADSTLSQGTFITYMTATWFAYGLWVFHTIHQLRNIHSLYVHKAQVDPFHPEPLYALSRISSHTTLLILPISYGWLALNASSGLGDILSFTSMIATNIFFVGLGVLIFIWPLWGAHRLLEGAKQEALAENAKQFRSAVKELHRDVEDRQTGDMAAWENALSALNIERTQLDRLATWPWAPGALRNLLAALFIPLLVWAAQYGLERLLD